MAGKPQPTRLWKEITLALVLKIAVLALIWLAWFSEDHAMDASGPASRYFSQHSSVGAHP